MTLLLGKYADNRSVSKYAEKGVASCIQAGVVSGRNTNTIAPKSNIARTEVAAVVQRMLIKTNFI